MRKEGRDTTGKMRRESWTGLSVLQGVAAILNRITNDAVGNCS